MYAAIDNARRQGGLKGKEANDLVRMTNAVGTAIDRQDSQTAAKLADSLVSKVRDLIEEDRVHGDAADRLLRSLILPVAS